MAFIKGIPVLLYEKTASGTDAFHHTTYTETPVKVRNVLVSPVASDDVVNSTQLNGKRAEYELCIPKSDLHSWENVRVDFFGKAWRTIGFESRQIDANTPLEWNARIRVERYE
ncbi:MAG: hypothetical protein RR825_00790 [Ruthenibacterium sp.]